MDTRIPKRIFTTYDSVDAETADVGGDGDSDVIVGGVLWYESSRPNGDPAKVRGKPIASTPTPPTPWKWPIWIATAVIEVGADYKLLATNQLKERCQASIAISQGNLFIRTEQHLYCIGRKSN